MYGVNLSQDQSVKMNSLQQAFAKETADLDAKIYQKQLELNGLLLQPAPDAAKISGVQKEISGLQLQLNEKSVSYQLEARKVLTAEQVAQLPPGCALGFGPMTGGGPGCGPGYGRGYGCGRGAGAGRGCWW
jgi:Spy/CpxP family protein refolding chaperone